MKDKAGKQVTMNDVIEQYKIADDDNIVAKQVDKEISQLTAEINTDEYLNKLRVYNENLNNKGVEYTQYCDVQPLHNVLVKVFVKEPEITESGLLKPYKQIVPVPTKAGYGDWAEIESPYPYDTLAIVVAKPDPITTIKVGDMVLLNKNPVEAKVLGQSNEAYITIPNAFTRPEWKEETPPKDPESIHYGYLLIPVYEIKCIL